MIGCLCAGLLAPSPALAQTAPPAVLVQPAALRVLAAQSEFIGRVKALDKVDLRARVQGFLGPRQFKAGERVRAGKRGRLGQRDLEDDRPAGDLRPYLAAMTVGLVQQPERAG